MNLLRFPKISIGEAGQLTFSGAITGFMLFLFLAILFATVWPLVGNFMVEAGSTPHYDTFKTFVDYVPFILVGLAIMSLLLEARARFNPPQGY